MSEANVVEVAPASTSAAFLRGVAKCAPIALSAIPFGAAAGMGAVEVGLTAPQASGMSLIMFAGAAQLAVLELAKSDAPWVAMVVVAITINLRFAMYSAGLSGWTKGRPLWVRVVLSYLLTDQAFAVTTTEAADTADRAKSGEVGSASDDLADAAADKRTLANDNLADAAAAERAHDHPEAALLVWFFAGAAVTLWAAWQGGTALGAAIGVQAPAELGLDLVAPLAFVALGATAVRTRADIVGATTALMAFGAFFWLPYGLGLLPAAAIGVGVRQWAQSREST